MYPPVAVATYASTPRITRAGVYIIAGPIPPKAADRDPINPTLKIVTRLLLLISKSPGTSWYPCIFFKFYSDIFIFNPTRKNARHIIWRTINKNQSIVSHLTKPRNESYGLFPPFNKFIKINTIMIPQWRQIFFHWKYELSLLIIICSCSLTYGLV